MAKLLDVIRVARDRPDLGLRKGMVGAVVNVHERAFEIEFVDAEGKTTSLAVLNHEDFEVVHTNDSGSVGERAAQFIRRHFEFLNDGDLEKARHQLFFPSGISNRPTIVYVEGMRALAPFSQVSVKLLSVGAVKKRQRGVLASIELDVSVVCSLGPRKTSFTVWWYPETDSFLISGRPSEWVLEHKGLR